jgi:hypothetical protein
VFAQDVTEVQKSLESADARYAVLQQTANGFKDVIERLHIPPLRMELMNTVGQKLIAFRDLWDCVAEFKRFQRCVCVCLLVYVRVYVYVHADEYCWAEANRV